VHFKILSRVEPLPGVVFFGVVVVLTMLSAMSFDPRLIWDNRKTSQ
jgi:paraquat-inducible protein A